jgi:hypothetical protein
MTISLSTAAFDSFQSAMISTGSNDFFRNKLNIWIIRACVVVIIIPVVVVALRSPDILQIFLISDLVSAAVVPCLVIGLSEKFYFYRGFDFVVGGLGGIFTIFLFGLVYYDGDVTLAGNLLLLEGGLYANDWSAFGKSKPHPFLPNCNDETLYSLNTMRAITNFQLFLLNAVINLFLFSSLPWRSC